MHIDATYPPTKDEIIKAMKSYGVPVVITELDVDISDVATKDRLLKQAQIYRTIFEAALESDSCKGIFMFQIGDRYSWLETDLGKSNADPTPYDDNLNPKISAYVIRAVLFNDLLRFSQ
jgi:GH35 family endo-1,4-beta-xylanase